MSPPPPFDQSTAPASIKADANRVLSELPYVNVATLSGPKDGVLSLKFSAFGKYLSAAGLNGIACWDVSTQAAMSALIGHAPEKKSHVFPATAWLYFARSSQHFFLAGNLKGRIRVWEYLDGDKEFIPLENAPETPDAAILTLEVLSVEVSEGRRARVAATFDDCSIIVWSLTSSGEFAVVFKTRTEDTFVPKSVAFDTNTKSLYVFSSVGGKVALLAGNTGEPMWTSDAGPPIVGSIDVDNSRDLFVAYTGNSFGLYKLNNLKKVRDMESQKAIVPFPKDVVFAEDGRKIVGGTDRGKGVIYDLNSGAVLQFLEYGEEGLVQPVAAFSLHDRFLIAIAGSGATQTSNVVLWQKMRFLEPRVPVWRTLSSKMRSISCLWLLLFVLATCSAIFINRTATYEQMQELGPVVHQVLEYVGFPSSFSSNIMGDINELAQDTKVIVLGTI